MSYLGQKCRLDNINKDNVSATHNTQTKQVCCWYRLSKLTEWRWSKGNSAMSGGLQTL